MTTMTRPRALAAVLAVAALLVGGARLASDATDPTTAAWTDDVHATTSVGLGTWQPSIGKCQPVDANLRPVDAPCSIVSVKGFVTGEGRPVGERRAQLRIKIDATQKNGVYYLLTVNLANSADAPANWVFQGGWFGGAGANLVAMQAPPSCTALPTATMLLPDWAPGEKDGVFLEVYEPRWSQQSDPSFCVRS